MCDKARSNANPEDKWLVINYLLDLDVYGPDFHLKLGDENSFGNWCLAAGGSKNAGNGVGPRCLYFRGVFCRMKPEMHCTPSVFTIKWKGKRRKAKLRLSSLLLSGNLWSSKCTE